MTTPEFHAHYLQALGMPALCTDARNHGLTIPEAEALITELQMAVLQARIAAKRLSSLDRLRTPETELDMLSKSFDEQFAAVFSPSDPSPASEVTP